MKKRLIIVGKKDSIEPLGVLHLLGIARDLGWERRAVLVDEFNYEPLFDEIRSFRPDRVDFSIWTGWHVQTFEACDRVRAMGIPVAIGGPHATYSTAQCVPHADVIVRTDGFRNYRLLLEGKELIGKMPEFPNVYFDPIAMADGYFPRPDRELVYEMYPYFARCPIHSIMCTVGCPFKCSYCYAPARNKLLGGFKLILRPVDDVIAEALEIKERWGARMIYFQDDIFGFRIKWLAEFVERWRTEVGIPWHCQVRLELVEGEQGTERLRLFKLGGCTGITLAVESGNAFLRQFVLDRAMTHELIMEGVRKIQSFGLTLRLEQILAVPFSDIKTDLATLGLNSLVNPEMAWTSILAPYEGTAMCTVAHNFGAYGGNNDDLKESFFERSVLRHLDGGIDTIEFHVKRFMRDSLYNPLLRMTARSTGDLTADVYFYDPEWVPAKPKSATSPATPAIARGPEFVCKIRYLGEKKNNMYADQTVVLQRLFMWFSLLPHGEKLGDCFTALPKEEWTWANLGRLTAEHLREEGYGTEMVKWRSALAHELSYPPDSLPGGVRDNPYYFCFLPSGAEFAKELIRDSHFAITNPVDQFSSLGRKLRHWLFERSLYKIYPATPPIASEPTSRHKLTLACSGYNSH